MIQIGVDDAGRGVLMGPLVIAGATVSEDGAERLENLGVRDSKDYKDAKTVVNRFMEIGSVVDKFSVRLLTPQELNQNNANGITLDRAMIPQIVDLVVELADGLTDIDVRIDNLQHKEELIAQLKERGIEALVEPEAEQYIAVAAASIVASAQFEIALRELRREYGEIGSGNPNDPKTLNWLKAWWKKNKSWPYFVRTFYKTIKRLEEGK